MCRNSSRNVLFGFSCRSSGSSRRRSSSSSRRDRRRAITRREASGRLSRRRRRTTIRGQTTTRHTTTVGNWRLYLTARCGTGNVVGSPTRSLICSSCSSRRTLLRRRKLLVGWHRHCRLLQQCPLQKNRLCSGWPRRLSCCWPLQHSLPLQM